VTTAETWTLAASPHVLPYDISISAQLVIEPCAVVRLAVGKTITINATGAFVAAGQPGAPVIIEPQVVGQAWSSIRNFGGVLSLSHAIVRGGGAPLNFGAAGMGALRMQSNGPGGTFHVDDVEITGSQSQGVIINGAIGFDATSQNLRIAGSTGFPLFVFARVIGSIPAGNYYGNGFNSIAIAGAGSGGPISDVQTMHFRGVPYHVGTGAPNERLDVNSQMAGVAAVLTIEPGVQLLFPPGGLMNIDPTTTGNHTAQGALIAIGTAAQPIVFGSERGNAGVAGDWLGIRFGGAVDSRSIMQHTSVLFAGGATVTGSGSCPYPNRTGQNDAAIRIFGVPPGQFITFSEISYSKRDGIDRGWAANVAPDFLPTNTFIAVAECKQSTPRTLAGACPANPPCP
jgi:hypothetical protein